MVLFGADRVEEYAHLFIGRTALLTGPSGRTSSNEPTFDVLKRCCDLRLLLAPEHGVRGDKPAGAVFADEVDEDTGLTVRSLYTKESKRLSADTLALFDTLVYDVADVGCRYYTFLTSLRYCMEDCAAAGKRLVNSTQPIPYIIKNSKMVTSSRKLFCFNFILPFMSCCLLSCFYLFLL